LRYDSRFDAQPLLTKHTIVTERSSAISRTSASTTMTPAKSQRKTTHAKPMTIGPTMPQTTISGMASSSARVNWNAKVTYSANSCVRTDVSSVRSAGAKATAVVSVTVRSHSASSSSVVISHTVSTSG